VPPALELRGAQCEFGAVVGVHAERERGVELVAFGEDA
jgi:hypothetical protein